MARANEVAYTYIRSRILDGTYRPAQRLIEEQLSEEIKVSRNTIKRALLQLEAEQLVTIEKNKGASVKSFTIDEIAEYYEVRRALEVIVVGAAIDRITDDEIDTLKGIYRHMCELRVAKDFDGYSKLNKQFHETIYQASGKRIAVNLIRNIKTQLMRFQFRTMLVPGRSDASAAEHKWLLDAFVARDKQAAIAAIETHVSNVSKAILENRELYY